jgi:hypothetical protein
MPARRTPVGASSATISGHGRSMLQPKHCIILSDSPRRVSSLTGRLNKMSYDGSSER